jgi:hypothetical protein
MTVQRGMGSWYPMKKAPSVECDLTKRTAQVQPQRRRGVYAT